MGFLDSDRRTTKSDPLMMPVLRAVIVGRSSVVWLVRNGPSKEDLPWPTVSKS